jgi:hypothetical protein
MEMEAKFVIRGRKLRLIHFMPSPRYESVFGQSKGLGRIKRPRQGISVLIRKDTGRKVVLGSFYGRSRGSSKIFIWKRVGEQRYPIKPLFTVSPANMMEKEGETVFQKLIHDDAGTVFNHELDFYLGKTNG